MKKRVLAVLLCLIFVISMLPGMVLADDGTSTAAPTSTAEPTPTAEPTSTAEPTPTVAPTSNPAPASMAAPALDSAATYGATTGDASNVTACHADIGLTYSAPASEQGYSVRVFDKVVGGTDTYNTPYIDSGLEADNVSGSVAIDLLLPGTTYEYYACIHDNASGTDVMGDTKTFTTAPADGALTPDASATLANANTGYVYEFVPASSGNYVFVLTGGGSFYLCAADGSPWMSVDKDAAFSVMASGLTAGATYYVYASGTSSGEVLSVSEADSGKCGANLTWSLDSGVLTISGTGDMYNGTRPWLSQRDSIAKVVLEEGVTSIGDGAFSGLRNLTEAVLPSSLTSIGDGAFYGCENLTNISIPSGLRSIGDSAFIYCRMPASLDLSGVTSIGKEAFVQCDGLTGVTLSGSIGPSAFQRCDGLTSVNLTSGVTGVAPDAFEDCTALQTILVDGADAAYTDVDGVLFTNDMSELVCYPAGRMADSYKVPSGVTSIGENAFESCAGLMSVTLPFGLTDIGGRAFCGCFNLRRIEIPDSVADIGPVAFNASGLTDVYYEGTEAQWDAIRVDMNNAPLTAAEIHYASYCYQAVTTGDAVSVTSGGAAVGVTYTYSVGGNRYEVGVNYGTRSGTYPDSTSKPESESAQNASETLTLNYLAPNTTYYYEAYLRDELTGATTYGAEKTFTTSAVSALTAGSPVTAADAGVCYAYSFTPSSSGNYRFALGAGGDIMIREASTGNYVSEYQERNAFSCVADLTAGTEYYVYVCADSSGAALTASVPEPASCGPNLTWAFDPATHTLTISGTGVMDNYDYQRQPWSGYIDQIQSIVLEDGVTGVGDFAFAECLNLTSLTLPSSLTDIGYVAFAACMGLTTLTLPAGLTSIGEEAFVSCRGLTSIEFPSGLTDIGYAAFAECMGLTSLTLPAGLTDIGEGAFCGCQSLTSVALPSGITRIEPGTFYDCAGLTDIAIPGGVQFVGQQAFDGCSALTDVYYGGTESGWSAVSIDDSNDPLTGATVHYNAYHALAYSANGGTGSMTDAASPYYPGATATVLPNGFTKTNYTFDSWNTKADGTGTRYKAGDTFTVGAETTLYAIWTENAKYTVTYARNNGTGSMTDSNSPYYTGNTATVLENTFTAPKGWMFQEWNTKPDGTGTSYRAGDTFSVGANTTLYAIWSQVPAVTVTAGGGQTHTLKSNGTLTITCSGALSELTTITVNGVTILDHTGGTTSNGNCSVSSGSTILTLKNAYLESLKAGTYTVTFNYKNGASATTTFTVKSGTPQTGDEMHTGLWLGLALGGCALLAGGGVFLFVRHRRETGKKDKHPQTGE